MITKYVRKSIVTGLKFKIKINLMCEKVTNGAIKVTNDNIVK